MIELTYINEYGEKMHLKQSEKKGYFLFNHEDCNGDGFEEFFIESMFFKYILSPKEMAVLSTFKLLLKW